MIETPNPEIDVDRLMAEIRSEARSVEADLPEASARRAGPPPDGRWLRLVDQLQVARENAAVGVEVPAFPRLPPLRRRLARLAARCVLYVAELVTRPQRSFNIATLVGLEQVADELRELRSEVETLRARLTERSRSAPGPSSAARNPEDGATA
jgi:hypothetical protein